MNFERITEVIDDHLQEVNDDQKERIKRIKEIQDFLAYNLRLTELTPDQLEDFGQTMDGGRLTDNMRKTFDECKTEDRKDYYITMWARSNYFRQCAWMSYLHGECVEKPFVQ